MSTPTDVDQQPDTKRDWRYYIGLFLFVLALILPLLGLAIVPLLGLGQGVSTALIGITLVGGPDVILIGSAALMGKENLEYLFSKLGGWFKRLVKWDEVSPGRYRTGVWLFWISILAGFAFFWLFPSTLISAGKLGWGAYAIGAADILFVVSFFVLGAEFWGKLRALFQYDARVVVEESSGGS